MVYFPVLVMEYGNAFAAAEVVTSQNVLCPNLKAQAQVLVKVCHNEPSVYEVGTHQNFGQQNHNILEQQKWKPNHSHPQKGHDKDV